MWQSFFSLTIKSILIILFFSFYFLVEDINVNFFARLDYLNLLMLGWTELFSSSSKWKVSIFFFSTTFRVSTVFTMVSGWWGMTTISLIWSTTRSHAIAWILEVRITLGLKEKECFYIYFHPTSFHYSYSKMNL